MNALTKQFSEINITDIGVVGCKNSLLGEMFSKLSSKVILVPDGFATTAFASEGFFFRTD